VGQDWTLILGQSSTLIDSSKRTDAGYAWADGAPATCSPGLLVCARCGYAYDGKALSPSARKRPPRDYAYYRCRGSDAYRFGGERLCHHTQVRTDRLEQAVEVCQRLDDPPRLAQAYARRLEDASQPHRNDPDQAL
jgi:site-specific DNA recombinase